MNSRHPGERRASATGGNQPPMNRIAAIAHIVVIATYSPSMNSRYGVEPYSTMKPATSSDSASTRFERRTIGSGQRRDVETPRNIETAAASTQFRNVSQGNPIRPAETAGVLRLNPRPTDSSEPAHSKTVMNDEAESRLS